MFQKCTVHEKYDSNHIFSNFIRALIWILVLRSWMGYIIPDYNTIIKMLSQTTIDQFW